MEFEWEKNKANLKKHGIDFEGSRTIWMDAGLKCKVHSLTHEEPRYLAIGLYKER